GGALHTGIPPGEDRERLCCDACGRIHYQNPEVDAACVFEAADGTRGLVMASLASGERIQEAALRALGAQAAAGLAEERLAFCCALTDTSAGRVCLVFRLEGVVESRAAPALPGWCDALLRRLAGERSGAPRPVYTAAWDGAELQIATVPRG
ncbi:MAG: zinc ribbon domain-containing protein, partial [Gammaproteobacteria bacterium]